MSPLPITDLCLWLRVTGLPRASLGPLEVNRAQEAGLARRGAGG